MRYAFCLAILIAACLVLQAALIPAFLPPVLRPDVCIMIGIAVLSFGSREFGLTGIFLLGINADMVGSGRFGLLTLCYLIATGAVLMTFSRELNRSDFGLPCIAGISATALAHGLYCGIGSVLGLNIGLGRAASETLSLLVAAIVWGLPCVWLTGKLMFRLRVMAPEVQARWANDERMNDAHRRQTA
jgi:hypothetical protein